MDDRRGPRAPTLRCVARAHFRIFGIPIRVEPFFFIVVALFGIRLEPLWVVFAFVVMAFISVLVHELGHAVTYRLLGQALGHRAPRLRRASPCPTGGGRQVLSKPKSVMVSMSGALTQLAAAGHPRPAAHPSDWGQEHACPLVLQRRRGFNWYPVADLPAFVSIWWAVFNLLPIRPLDGGQVAETLFGFQAACKLSIGAAIVAGFITFRSGPFGLIGLMYFGLFALLNFRDLREDQRTGTFDVDAPDAAGRGGARGAGAAAGPNLSVVRPAGGHPRPHAPPARGPRPRPGRGTPCAQATGAGPRRSCARPGAAGTPSCGPASPWPPARSRWPTTCSRPPTGPSPAGPPTWYRPRCWPTRAAPSRWRPGWSATGRPGVEAASGLQTHLHYAERFRAAAEVGEQVFAAGPQSPAQTAFEVACSWARAGNPDEALRWVEAAVDAGSAPRACSTASPTWLRCGPCRAGRRPLAAVCLTATTSSSGRHFRHAGGLGCALALEGEAHDHLDSALDVAHVGQLDAHPQLRAHRDR